MWASKVSRCSCVDIIINMFLKSTEKQLAAPASVLGLGLQLRSQCLIMKFRLDGTELHGRPHSSEPIQLVIFHAQHIKYRFQVLTAASMKMAVCWDVVPCGLVEFYRRFRGVARSIIALIMESASTSETSLNFYQTTRHNIPEDSHLHTRSCENLKSVFNVLCIN
jgi:hypothetical protein